MQYTEAKTTCNILNKGIFAVRKPLVVIKYYLWRWDTSKLRNWTCYTHHKSACFCKNKPNLTKDNICLIYYFYKTLALHTLKEWNSETYTINNSKKLEKIQNHIPSSTTVPTPPTQQHRKVYPKELIKRKKSPKNSNVWRTDSPINSNQKLEKILAHTYIPHSCPPPTQQQRKACPKEIIKRKKSSHIRTFKGHTHK